MRETGPQRLHTTPITSQFVDQRLEHQVTDEALAARHANRDQALCGRLFVAADHALITAALQGFGLAEPTEARPGWGHAGRRGGSRGVRGAAPGLGAADLVE